MSTLASSSVILLELCTTVQLSWCWPAAVSQPTDRHYCALLGWMDGYIWMIDNTDLNSRETGTQLTHAVCLSRLAISDYSRLILELQSHVLTE